eukprot:TRINITY_DN7385_c0_g1_i1.p2 TRINITY_DN7385_c0_g1~~TRINITY_DN7385_c0_g1_i1.p2  ORF type:complete len:387 (-),score=42.53 TRINITY_DN7385_c0_g1_i1:691-1851(-)
MGLFRNEKGSLRWPCIEISKGPGLTVTGTSSVGNLKQSAKTKKAAGWIVEKNEDISQRSCLVESSMSNRSKGGSDGDSNSSSEVGNLSWRVPRTSFDSTSSNKSKEKVEDKEKHPSTSGKQLIYDEDNIIIINGDESFPVIVPKLNLEGLGKKQVSTIMPRRGVLKDNDEIYSHVMQNEKITSPPRFDLKLPLTPVSTNDNRSDEAIPQTPRLTPSRLQTKAMEEYQRTKQEEIELDESQFTGRWSVDVLMSDRREISTSRFTQNRYLDFIKNSSSNKNDQQQKLQAFLLPTEQQDTLEVETPRLGRGRNFQSDSFQIQVQNQQNGSFQQDSNGCQQSKTLQHVSNLLATVVIYMLLSRTHEFRNRSLVIWGLSQTLCRTEKTILR